MRIANLTRDQMEMLAYALDKSIAYHEDFYIAYDVLDNGIKWKVGQFTWSAPIKTEER